MSNALTRSIFELEKCSLFNWVRSLPEIDWYHYQGAYPAPSLASDIDKDTHKLSVTSEPSVPPPSKAS